MADIDQASLPGHVDDLLAVMAIGSIEAEDRLAVERHLAGCQRCRDEFEALEAAAAAVGSYTLRSPRPGLWESIERSLPYADGRLPAGASPRSLRWRWWGSVAAATAAGLLLGMASAVLLRGETGPTPLESIQRVQTNDVVFTLATVAPDSGAAGRIFMNDARTEGVVAVTGLPPLPASERYAVWIVRDDDIRIAAGTFSVDSGGSAVAALTIPELSYDWTVSGRYVALSISRVAAERPGTPVGGPVLVGPLY